MKKVYALVLSMFAGSISQVFAGDAAPSSHLYYSGGNANSDIWMNSVYVPITTLYTYYSVMGWNTGSEGGGYCGIQDSPDGGHKYIFSIWDPSNNQAITAAYAGSGTIIQNFGGEGTGLQSNNPVLGWNINTWYNQVTRVWQYNGHTFFGYWNQDMSTGIWSHIVTMDYPVANVTFQGGNDSFIEDWEGSGVNTRKVLYKDAWQRSTAGTWKLQKAASFSSNSGDAVRNGVYDQAFNSGIENGAFFMQTGGSTTHTFTGRSTNLNITSTAAAPTLTIGAVSSFQAAYLASNQTFNVSWVTDQTKSPQFSYTVDVFSNAQHTGTPVLTVTDKVPHQRAAALNASTLVNGTYYLRITIKDIFDQTSTAVYATAAKTAGPTVSVTSPADNTNYNSPANITINATAADANGTISKVEFYNGTTLLGSDATSPYSYTWTSVGFGTYTITAKATNSASVSSMSTAVTVKVNSACNVNGTAFGTSPAYNNGTSTFAKVFDGDTTTFFDYSQASGGYAGLDFGSGKTMYVNTISFFPRTGWTSRMTGGKFQGSNSATFASGVVDLYTIANEPSEGWNTVTVTPTAANAFRYVRYLSPTDGNCNIAELKICGDFTIANILPTVSITSPANNAAFTAPATITINASASDGDGTVSKVEFYNGTTLLGSDASSPYTYTWTGAANGTYTITAKATDNSGGVSASAAVTIVVSTTTDVSDNTLGLSVSLYPNPTTGFVNFTAPADAFVISDITGKVLQHIEKSGSQSADLSAYPSGVYIIEIHAGPQAFFQKIIKE